MNIINNEDFFKSLLNSIKENRALYKDHPGINNSTFKVYEYSPLLYYKTYITKELEKKEEANTSFKLGSLVDCLLTTPEDFESTYCIAPPFDLPSGNMELFMQSQLASYNVNSSVDIWSEEVLKKAYSDSGYKPKYETVIEKNITDNYKLIVDFYKINSNKIVITPSELSKAKTIVESAQNCERDSRTIQFVNPDKADIVLNQVPLFAELPNNISVKALLDQILVFKNEKLIVIKDYKTTSSSLGFFHESVAKYRYPKQAAWYKYVLSYLLQNTEYKDYTIDFYFLAMETNQPFNSKPFRLSEGVIAQESSIILMQLVNYTMDLQDSDFDYTAYKQLGYLTLDINNLNSYGASV
jgi:hypothetical protein